MKRKQDEKELLTDAFEYAKDAKGFLYKTAEAIRQVEGEGSWLFQRFDSHYNDVDDSIDDLFDMIDDRYPHAIPIGESHDSVMKGIHQSNQADLNKAIEGITNALDILDLAIGSKEIENVPMIEDKILDARDALLNALPSTHAFNESSGEEWFSTNMGELIKPLPMDCIIQCSSGGQQEGTIKGWLKDLPGFVEQFENNEKLLEMAKSHLEHMGDYDPETMSPYEVAMNILWDACCSLREEANYFVNNYEFSNEDDYEYPDDTDDWMEEDWEHFQTNGTGYYLGD